MSLPNYQSFYAPFLKALADGNIHIFKDLKKDVIQQMGLSEEDLAEKLPSGRQSIFENRIGWARTYSAIKYYYSQRLIECLCFKKLYFNPCIEVPADRGRYAAGRAVWSFPSHHILFKK